MPSISSKKQFNFTMILRIFLTLILIAIPGVVSMEISGIFDINSINNFFKKLTDKVDSDMYALGYQASNDTKNRILQHILSDTIEALQELSDELSDDPLNENWFINFRGLLKNLQESEIKRGSVKRSFMPLVRQIQETSGIVNTHVDSIVFLRESNYFSDLIDLCPLLAGIKDFLEVDYQATSIATLYKNFIDNIFQDFNTKTWWKLCGQRSSLREGLFKFYRFAMTSYLKEFVIYLFITVAHARCDDNFYLSRRNSPGTLGFPIEIFRRKFNQNIRITRDTIGFHQFFTYRCDTNDFDKYNREWYYELEKMIQTIIINEKDMSTSQSCSHNCDVSTIKSTINHSECKEFRDCHLIAGSFEMCKTYENYNSRRYQWFNDTNGIVYGNDSEQCYEKESVDSYYEALQLRYCDYCMCTCVKKQKRGYHVVTAISFRDQVSNIEENMAVVGVRFVREGYMIHVQIKEGKLGPPIFNQYDPWKQVDDIDYDETTEKYFIKNKTDTPLVLGLDYGHPEIMNFDDLIAPHGYVVTGVRFRFAGDLHDSPQLKSGSIELQIRVSPIEYIQRQIINDDRTHWISPVTKDQRAELTLSHPDLPTKSSNNTIDSEPTQFIRFQASDLKKDAGQSTVPFFDAMEVEGFPGFPLGGVGIIHRGKNGFGGYLAFKVFDLDLSYYFKDDLSELS